jgi:hypothetical protein
MNVDKQLWDDRHLAEEGAQVNADTKVYMTYEGERFVLALTKEHASDLHARVEPYLSAARKARAFRQDAACRTSIGRAARQENSLIRRWARQHGFKIGSGGPIKQEIRDAYRAAHPVQD